LALKGKMPANIQSIAGWNKGKSMYTEEERYQNHRQSVANWQAKNKRKRYLLKRKYEKASPEKTKTANRRRNECYRIKNRERIRDFNKKYREKDKEAFNKRAREYQSNRCLTNLKYRLIVRLRGRLSDAIRGKSGKCSGSHITNLGCSIAELKMYLEGQFRDGMSWENYGRKGWHIDHKIPLAFFDLSDIEQLKKACHYSNLQPLWAQENLIKGKKLLYV